MIFRKQLCLLPFLFLAISASAQKNVIDQALEEEFLLRVKQLDEFMKRFNYQWSINNKPLTYTVADSLNRKRYLLALFDVDYLEKADSAKKEQISRFIAQVGSGNQPFFLSFHQQDWYAEAEAEVLFRGKTEKVSLVFKTHLNAANISSWQLVSVHAEFMSLSFTDSLSLTPISHELNFTKFAKATEQSAEQIASIAADSFREDQLSIFFFLLKNGLITVSKTTTLTYHFLQVPGWIFQVKHFERKEGNLGWLISGLQLASEPEKERYQKVVLFFPK